MPIPKLFFVDSGRPGNPTLIFLHAFPFTHTMWEEQAKLCEDRYRVVVYDHRGHGQSELGSHPYLFESLVDDLLGLMDSLRIEHATLIGLSMGGYVALRAAEREPDIFHGLVLCDTRSESDSDAAKLKRSADLKLIQEAGLEVFAERFLQGALSPQSLKNTVLRERIKRMILVNSSQGAQEALVALATRTDTTASLNHRRAPTLILVGEADVITPPAAARALHDRIPDSNMMIIPQAGHLSNLENPSVFSAHLMEFLALIHS